MSAKRTERAPRSKSVNFVSREHSIFCPIYEERLDLRECFLRYFAARSRSRSNHCANCHIIAERAGDLHKVKIIQALRKHAPSYVDLAMLAKKAGQHQTSLETILSAMVTAGVIEASLVYCRGAVRPRKIYRLKPDPNAAVDLGEADEVCDE